MGFFRQSPRYLSFVNTMDGMAKKNEDPFAWLKARIASLNANNPTGGWTEKFEQTCISAYNLRLENRAKKAAQAASAMTCQICERKILANTGVIALHGFTRPGHGWQTPSCFGAKYMPYETACDAMQPYIDMVSTYRAQREEGLKGLMEDPPEDFTLTISMRPFKSEKVTRPEGFDPAKVNLESYTYEKYEREWRARVYQARTDITNATGEITRMEIRLAEWTPKKGKKKK